MRVEKEVIERFFESIEALEADKKEIADAVKDAFTTFADNHEINKKAVLKAFKEWQAWKKDNAEYTEIDYESDALLVTLVPEFATEPADVA